MSKSGIKRDSNFELLRVIAMLMIILCHFASNNLFTGIVVDNPDLPASVGLVAGYSDKTLGLSMLRMFGKSGVLIFAMISGYFLINKPFNFKRITDLSVQSIWYMLVLVIFMSVMTPYELNLLDGLRVFFPLVMASYWYPTAIAIVFLISPVLNLAIKRFDHRSIKRVIGVLIVLMGFPLLVPDLNNDIFGVILGYVLGAYVREFGVKVSKWMSVTMILGALVFTAIVTGVLLWLAPTYELAAKYKSFFVQGFNINSFVLSFALFTLFHQINLGNIKFINIVASTTFGIYLFHENPMLRFYLWRNIIDTPHLHGVDLVVGGVGAVAFIFILGMCIDLIRQEMFSAFRKIYVRISSKVPN